MKIANRMAKVVKSSSLTGLLCLLSLFVHSGLQAQEAASEEVLALAAEVAFFAAEIQLLEDENEIENLQRIFGFYIDKKMWSEAADLFSASGTIEIGGEGIYQGKARVLEYLQKSGDEGIETGVLNDHMQLQPIIHVANNNTAKGRWHHFSQEAVHGESHYWGSGVYENDYIKEGGLWKIQSLHLFSTMRTPYNDGWGTTSLPRTSPSEELPADLPPSVDYENYPTVYVVPFHYQNPVTGNASDEELNVVNVAASLEEVKTSLASLQSRVGLLADADAVEYLHAVYGYYLARNQWDELAGIFAEDGSIEIAQRGVYVGQASVRRNLDLYGVQSELPGILHNHMQYQPVIHISENGQTASMRSRAFSMMGGYEGVGRWMGGVYENTFVKRDGIWKIATDQVFNTYMASYDDGWKDSNFRTAPGISTDNPPDQPPTTFFEMFPSSHLPPFHYVNPVTGD